MPNAQADTDEASQDQFLSFGDAVDLLGVSPWILRKWERARKVRTRRNPVTGRRIYCHEDLSAILAGSLVSGSEETGELEDHLLAPISTSISGSTVGRSEHFVQFYETDLYLAQSVAEFIARPLEAGEPAIIIATSSHRAAIRKQLTHMGADVNAAVLDGRLTIWDAAETLSRFMVDGSPNPEKFRRLIGGAVKKMSTAGRHLRAFGEMVALLWADGNRAAAIRLEELWNELGKEHSFSLFCAYRLQQVGSSADAQSFSQICSCHSRVIPAESYSSIVNSGERLRVITQLQQKAQSLQAEITHRKEVEKSLARREQELHDFLDNAAEGIYQIGPTGLILQANKAALKLLGYPRSQFVGRRINEFHIDAKNVASLLAKLSSAENLSDFAAGLRCSDGAIKQVHIQANPHMEGDAFIHARCFIRDVTAILESEQRHRQLLETERAARAEAERVSLMKDEFLATLSHESRTPLSAIFGWTQLIKKSPADLDTVNNGISIIDRNVRAQTRLIEDLLDMSRIISGKVRLDLKPIELIPVLHAAVDAVTPAADAKGIRIHQVLDSLAAPIVGDSGRLQQVVWNLLNNAVKFTPAGGKIELLLERVNSHIEITVTDNGQGIAPAFLPHVFERFRQADSTIARKHGGLGLGLAIVKQLVELHGGWASAKSAGEGHGASFTISLPLNAAIQPAPRNVPAGEDNALDLSDLNLNGVTVLVVDDEPDARELLNRLLTDYHATVILAASAAEAIEHLQTRKPDVLVSDIGMPGKNGHQLMTEIRSLDPGCGGAIPALALTAFARSQDRTQAMKAGFQVHISKPIEPRELMVTVAMLARSRK